ncbi:MAG: alkaline phosphatase family protein [Edaphobacter sp.]|uniref:alkaline phosphatase family protein n=1 Tax=Edaphobacter sp. TaxID=1934404 RepID=UPI00238C1043|nr:alkaline phosphatase family protein [Edaphobacter sp.]MDE1175470.1 alkaline phosphatase family protein [Edaphobacter sp.]
MRGWRAWLFAAMTVGLTAGAKAAENDARVVLVMTDGMRWQEIFRGADESLLTKERYYNGRSVDELKTKYLAATPDERRQKLMPFLWSTFIPQGQIYGDRDAGSEASVTNGFNFSYPGYNETLTGHGDSRIDSNDDKPNPNLTVLAWVAKQPGFQGKVAAFGAWHVIANVVNPEMCMACMVNAGYDPVAMSPMTREMKILNDVKANSPRGWEDEAYDAPVFESAMEYIRIKKPRVIFLSLGETDEWAHAGNYGEYLEASHRVDGYLKRMWETLQAMPEYKGKTTMIFMVDHGRGSAPEEWKSHGQKVPESKSIFMGFTGHGVPAVGVEKNVAPVTQSQAAATLAKYLGLDWDAAEKQAGKPIDAAVK